MVQRVEIQLVDDFDGGTAEETVTFALDGAQYDIDLSKDNAATLRGAVQEWTEHARRTRGGRKRVRRTDLGPTPKVVRRWAQAHGYTLSDRGRVPAEIRAAYDRANTPAES